MADRPDAPLALPRSAVESAIVEICESILGTSVAADDDFLVLGGDSIGVVRLIARIRERFEVEVPVQAFFDEPTAAALTAKVEAARVEGLGVGTAPALVQRLDREGPASCSFAQERFWFVDQASPNRSLANVSWPLRVRGALDAAVLERALTEVVRRHEVLRTRFGVHEGRPVQFVDPPQAVPLRVIDLSSDPDPAQAALAHVQEETRVPFDLERAPLLRAQLLRLGDADHVLQLVIHHIVVDDWSMGVVLRELGILYDAFARGAASPLAEPAVQYGRYSEWQREWLGEDVLDAELDHWTQELAGMPPALELPTDRPRPAVASLRGGRYRLPLDDDLIEKLRALGREEGATFFMTMLSALDVLLYRCTGEEDVVVGTAVDNRPRPELEDAIGVFTNPLVIRTDLSGEPSFRELLARVRGTTSAAVSHRHLPFDRLAAEAQARDDSRHAVFQVFFEFVRPGPLPFALQGFDLELFTDPREGAEFDVGLYLDERGPSLEALWVYSADLFDESTIERLASNYVKLLEAIVADPDRSVADLRLLSDSERRRLLVDLNDTVAAVPAARVHELFEQQVGRTPENVAVTGTQGSLTYAELNRRANQLAHLLRSSGVVGGDTVGLCLDRSTELIVALLGILKAGAAYVPLNAEHPSARLEQQLADSGAKALVTQSSLGLELPAFDRATILVDADAEQLAAQSVEDASVRGGPDDLVYVLYTSGSTGVPKGVAVRHRNLVNYATHMLGKLGEGGAVEDMHFAVVSAISTDLGNTTIFPCLLGGGCLHVVDEDTAKDGALFAAYLRDHAVDVIKITPSHLRSLFDAAAGERVLPRRWLITGGEAATWDLIDRVAATSGLRILNHYGPTETTVGSCTYEVELDGRRPLSATVPIGRPISNTRVYILDAAGEPAPVGVRGELHIAGAGVASGYVGRPEQTAEVFVRDPFSDDPDALMYRTGDVARYLDDGNIEFLGRRDEQVKIRGYRVEPAEVEAVLAEHARVRRAAVVASGEGSERQLIAYVVPDGGAAVTATELRTHLERTLPAYMVPAAFVSLDTFPLTPNGKLDRRALPEPEVAVEPQSVGEQPQTETELRLAQIWTELLERPAGLDDNFFESGGHSLLAVRLIARIRTDFEVPLTLRDFVDDPTIRSLAAKLAAAGGEEAAIEEPPPLVRSRREGPARSSFAQEQFWLVDQLAPGRAAYNFSWPFRLRGQVSRSELERALGEMVRRHEALRTRFGVIEGRPVQVVDPAPDSFPLLYHDLRNSTDSVGEAQALVDEQTGKPFDLELGPLLRVQLLQLADEEHILQVVVHHIVFDGVSKLVFLRELSEVYAAFASGHPSPLADPAVQYGDYAEWQREWIQGDVIDRLLEHWKEQLDGIPEALDLPSDRPRPAVASQRGARRTRTLPAELKVKLETLAQSERATFFMTVLAAFDVLLHRYTGQDDVVVGTPVDNRGRPEIEEAIGVFINTLVLRADLSGAPTFRELLGRVRERTIDAVAHQELPFERLVQELHPERDVSRHPIFQVLLAVNPAEPEQPLELPGVEVTPIATEWSAARVDLFLVVEEQPHGLDVIWEYSTDLFDADTIDRLDAHFVQLLEAIVADPDRSVRELPLLTDDERRRLLDDWNDTAAAIPPGCLHDLVSGQAAAAPHRVAVEFEGRSLTYAELEEQANRLGHHLVGLGVQPEDLVGICVERCEDMVVGLLGILKAGAAYVPIDPAYPAERQRFMLADANVRVLVTQEPLLAGIPPTDADVVCLDRDRRRIAAEPSRTPNVPSDPDRLAYVIYTSGSTGEPKGVEIPHRALVNFLATMRERPGLARDDVLLAVTTLSFDIAGLELYLPLVTGARLVIAPRETSADPARLTELLERSGATVMQATPTTWQMLLDDQWQGDPRLKALCGGEALPSALADALVGRVLELWNMYGPTETTIWSSVQRVVRGEPLTIGRPIANTTLFVLDELLKPVPVGVPGELYIGGAGLARGYRCRPDLTDERFVPDPFDSTPGARLYRTGDLARYRPDGNVEFLGRLDQQVKVRGFRIELEEVETQLARHPSVSAAVASTHAARPGENRLVAYVIADGEPPSAPELRRFLEQTLPGYMVPTSIVSLAAFPLTPNGKVDRKALPAPEGDLVELVSTYLAPRDETEEQLAALWSELLERDRVGVHDDFFEAGGHSLLAARVMARVRSEFDVSLPLLALFETPTIAALAEKVEAARAARVVETKAPGLKPPPLVATARTRRCSFVQERFWFIDKISDKSAAYNVSWPLRLHGPLDVALLERALSEIVRRHEILRTHFATEDGQPVQIVEAPAPVVVSFIDLSAHRDPEREAQQLVDSETQTPFDLARGPLMRLQAMQLGVDDYVLQIVFHHIVFDGVSKGVFFRELSTLYAAFAAGRPSPLPELAIQYGDYAEWQRSWLQGDLLAQELAFWDDTLDGAPAGIELPADHQRPTVSTLRGAWHRVALPADLVARLRALARTEGATLFMTLLAAFDVLLHRYSGQDDIVVGTPVDNRGRPELEDAIGVFINTLPIRSSLSGSPTFSELLTRVRADTLEAMAHQDLPFERLVQELDVERDHSRHPVFQVLLALDPPESPLVLPGVRIQPMDTEKTTSRLDLTVIFQEREDGLSAVWEYSTDLFDPATIERMSSSFLRLLEEAAADPGRSIDELAILTEAERQRLLVDLNDTKADYPDRALHELVEEQVERTPDATAVVFEETSLTYRELNERGNQLARRLLGLGVSEGSLVGVSVERSLELVVALLGVLKAGAAYVPIDPSYPADRIAYILESSQPRVILTQERLLAQLPSNEATVMSLDRDWPEIAHESRENPGVEVGPDELAYVIYTSGSTGRPKGVQIPHRALVNFMVSMAERPGLTADDVLLAVTTLSFDIAGLEIYLPLIVGGRVVVCPQEATADPRQLARLIEACGASVMQATPTTWRMLVDSGWHGRPGFKALCGGEALPLVLADALVERNLELWNMYGPTETTIWSTAKRVTTLGEPLTIGRPIANTTLYVLDEALQPVSVGVPGELHIGGAGLARGYRGRPDLTAERFVPDPFDPVAGARLYKTGDLVRYRDDGEVEFMGRLDHQVKVRGFRVELGEIETVLTEHDGISESVVVAVERSQGLTELAAYVVPDDEHGQVAPSHAELRAFLSSKLPGYMVPSSLTFLEAMPVTPNGKLDRAALPAPDREGSREQYVAPVTEAERLVAETWIRLLDVERVGTGDDFFELGGHSLLAARVAARLSEKLGLEVSIRALFEHPVAGELAKHLEAIEHGSDAREPRKARDAAILPRVSDGPGPLSFSQHQLWFLDQWQPSAATYNMVAGLRLSGPLDVPALRLALQTIVQRHESLRTVFRVDGDEPVQVVRDDWELDLQVVELGSTLANREDEARRLVDELIRRPFDLESDLLLRTTLIRIADDEHLLVVQSHHIVFDGSSETLLFSELGELYDAHRSGRAPVLPELPVQYSDFVAWQREQLTGDLLHDQLAYWRKELAGAPTNVGLPTDRPRPAVQTFVGKNHFLSMPREVADRVRDLARHEHATPFMVLLAGFATLLYRVTGQSDILFGTPVANRTKSELEHLIGFVSNTLVLRVRLQGNPTFRELLGRVRESALGAFAHQDTPFEKVVDAVSPQRDPGVNPLFQVNFRAIPAPPDAELAGLEVERLVGLDSGSSRFDLAVELHLNPDGIGGYVKYNTDLFDADTIARLAEDLEQLLGSALAQPDTRLLSLGLASEQNGKPGVELARDAGIRGFRGRSPAQAGTPEPVE